MNYITKFYLKNGRVVSNSFNDYKTCKEISMISFENSCADYYRIIDYTKDSSGVCVYDSRNCKAAMK